MQKRADVCAGNILRARNKVSSLGPPYTISFLQFWNEFTFCLDLSFRSMELDQETTADLLAAALVVKKGKNIEKRQQGLFR